MESKSETVTHDPILVRISAGAEALQEGRWSEARETFEAVLSEHEIPDARFGLAEALWWLGEREGMMDQYERAYAGFCRSDDPASAAGAALLISFFTITYLSNHVAADGWLSRAARLIEEHDIDPLRCQLALFEGCLHDDPADVAACARRAVEQARASGDVDTELCALSLEGHALTEQGKVGEGMALLDETMAAALGGESERLDTVVFTSCNMMVSCAKCAAFERATEWVRAAERFAERFGAPFLFAECRLVYGNVLFATGRWEEAEQAFIAALELARDAIPAFFAEAAAGLAQLRIAQGRIEEAERLIDGLDAFDAIVPVAARLHLLAGRPDAAAALASRRLGDPADLRLGRVLLVELLGDCEIARGDTAAAVERGRRLIFSGDAEDCGVAVARGERLLGRALAARGDAGAAQHLHRARSEFNRLGMPFEVALTGLASAEALATVQPELAMSDAQAALRDFERLGADRCADEAASLLRRLGVKVARSGPRTDGDITQREEEVLSLLGEGLSNPEIAERLFISRKTVEHHVSNVLAKLELRNRSEAAAEAVRRGLTGTS